MNASDLKQFALFAEFSEEEREIVVDLLGAAVSVGIARTAPPATPPTDERADQAAADRYAAP